MAQSIAIQALIQACGNKKIPFKNFHKDNNLIEVEKYGKKYFFSYTKNPLNDAVVYDICRDKDYTYTLLNDLIEMPKTLAFIDPSIDPMYIDYVKQRSVKEIIQEIVGEFDYPLILKPNRGATGTNVQKVDNRRDAQFALERIFDKNSKTYDYVALVQEYIEVDEEYRAVVVDGEIELVYKKDISNATFSGNQSPLHWEGAKAVHITNQPFIEKLENFLAPIFKRLPLRYAGLDIAVDAAGDFYLIEINGSPQFTKFVEDNGLDEIVRIYEGILESL